MRTRAITFATIAACAASAAAAPSPSSPRERIPLNEDWRFKKGDPPGNTISLLYDVRPDPDDEDADERRAAPSPPVLKPWILPTGNAFIADPARRFERPEGNPGGEVAYVQADFDDSSWERVTLPHDWAIAGPFEETAPGGGMKCVNLHHDLGPLDAAFNRRAAERQLEILREMGCNAIRVSHNAPAPELLELTDRMGFLVMDEAFDVWERRMAPLDFHLIFPEWHEQDLRALIRRDRNHPSVIMWSIGNEPSEQYTEEGGAEWGRRLHEIARDEVPTRPTTAAMNRAQAPDPLPAIVDMDVISLNYQGAGVRSAPGQFREFRERHPSKPILSSETAAAVSSRGVYLFRWRAASAGRCGRATAAIPTPTT